MNYIKEALANIHQAIPWAPDSIQDYLVRAEKSLQRYLEIMETPVTAMGTLIANQQTSRNRQGLKIVEDMLRQALEVIWVLEVAQQHKESEDDR